MYREVALTEEDILACLPGISSGVVAPKVVNSIRDLERLAPVVAVVV